MRHAGPACQIEPPSLARVCTTHAWVAYPDMCAGRRSQGSFDLKGVLPPVPDNVRLVKVSSKTPPYFQLDLTGVQQQILPPPSCGS